MKYFRMIAIALLVLLVFRPAKAEIIDSTANGFTVRVHVTIAGTPPEQVYLKMVHDVGTWWNSAHSWSGDARNLSIDARAGGGFTERLKDGGSVQHMTVVFADPGKTLRMSGGLGPLQSLAVIGSMTWSLTKSDGGTDVVFMYAVGGYRPGGLSGLAAPVNAVLGEQLNRFKAYVEKGSPE